MSSYAIFEPGVQRVSSTAQQMPMDAYVIKRKRKKRTIKKKKRTLTDKHVVQASIFEFMKIKKRKTKKKHNQNLSKS